MSGLRSFQNVAFSPWTWVGALLTLNVLLVGQNLRMRALIPDQPEVPSLERGHQLATVRFTDLAGDPKVLDFSATDRTQIFLFFSPECQFCDKQFPIWKESYWPTVNDAEVTGLVRDVESSDEVLRYLDLFSMRSLPIVRAPTDILRELKLAITPTTLVVDRDGRVRNFWIGVWDDETRKMAKCLIDQPKGSPSLAGGSTTNP